MNTIICPKCRKELSICDVVRNVYFRERSKTDEEVVSPPDLSSILFVHEWELYNVPDWQKIDYYRRQSLIVADYGSYIPKHYCEVSQEGVPLYLAKLIGLSTMEEVHHEATTSIGKERVAALNRIADATADAGDSTILMGNEIGCTILRG
jgi:hypothetical protein